MEILQVIIASLPSWKSVSLEELSLKRLTGITNVTYLAEYVGSNSIEPRKMIVRQFGTQAADVFIDTKQERQIYLYMAKNQQGP